MFVCVTVFAKVCLLFRSLTLRIYCVKRPTNNNHGESLVSRITCHCDLILFLLYGQSCWNGSIAKTKISFELDKFRKNCSKTNVISAAATRDVAEGRQGEQCQCPGRRITGGAEKYQQCRKYFLQDGKFAPKDLKFEHGGAKTCFLPQAPTNAPGCNQCKILRSAKSIYPLFDLE